MAGASRPILITFAIPHESSDFRRSPLRADHRVIHTGIGPAAAQASVEAALASHRPEFLLSVGFAGGLDPSLSVGDLVADPSRSAPEFVVMLPSQVRRGPFLSVTSPLESACAKETAFRETRAIAVDMETEAIAATCSKAHLPALFLRVISDGARDEIPLPFSTTYNLGRQRSRPLGVCIALLRSPSRIAPFTRFLRDMKTARAALTHTILDFLGTQGSA